MRLPDDALKPRREAFAEAWHAQVLAAAFACVEAGHFTATAWAEALGLALREAEASGSADTEDTYYHAVLTALERLVPLSAEALGQRKSDWEAAYLSTPHGQPVELAKKA